jgi:hypothetical protein
MSDIIKDAAAPLPLSSDPSCNIRQNALPDIVQLQSISYLETYHPSASRQRGFVV